jgi:hypothetical protein
MMKRVLLAIPCLFLALAIGRTEPAKGDRVAETRTKYAKQPADALKIAEPVKVSNVFYWKDGGSIGIELTDAKERKHLFCLDGRNEKEGGTRNLYVGADYPTKTGAAKASVLEESALYGVMLRWADKHPKREALYNEKLDLNLKENGNLWEIRAFFLRLDGRFTR